MSERFSLMRPRTFRFGLLLYTLQNCGIDAIKISENGW